MRVANAVRRCHDTVIDFWHRILELMRSINLIAGSRTILPGITLHGVGGHTKSMQIVAVETASGTAVVASDAAHSYRNFQEYTPFPILHDVPGMLDGFDRMYELASREDLILPGHDGQVMQRYPLVTEREALLE